MINIKEETKNKASNNIKEVEEFLDNQRQQLQNTTSTISETIKNINEYQKTKKAILEKSIDTANKYQQEIINTILSISNNYVELQNNILDTYQSAFSKFINDTTKYYISENRDIRKSIKNDILKSDLLSQVNYRFIEDRTINYINQIRKSSKNELFVDYNRLLFNDKDIKQYVKHVVNEISKKNDENNKNNKKE